MDNLFLKEWLNLTEENRRNIFGEIAKSKKLPAAAIEKDWWVVRTLQIIFETEIASQTVFKGGTSLSKAWALIDRLSEDIDLALDKKFFGFDKEMTGSQVSKLRKHSFKYISEIYLPLIENKFRDYGFSDLSFELIDVHSTDDDPLKIAVNYPSVTEKSEYLPTRVLIEIGSRSLIEPYTKREFSSYVGEFYHNKSFADNKVIIPAVNPERTFLEKIFLLHEEFQQSPDRIRIDKKSRHPFDLEKLMDTQYAGKALADKLLYLHIVKHRKIMTPIRGIDYTNHVPHKINILPPTELIPAWEKDYQQMQESMIHSESLPFAKLMERMKELNSRINNIRFLD